MSVNALCFTSCEGKPDSLLRAIPWGDLYLCGTQSIEAYHDTAEPPPGFPFSRVTLIPRGLIGRYAISGFEDGIGKGIVFVGDDGVVYALNGYQPTKISTPDVDRAIRAWLDAGGVGDDFELSAYVVGGHSCIKLGAPAWATGHGPIFGYATPLNSKGEWSFDVAFDGRNWTTGTDAMTLLAKD